MCAYNVPLLAQRGVGLSQLPFCRHVTEDDPSNIKPLLHWTVTLLPDTAEQSSGEQFPCPGSNRWHITESSYHHHQWQHIRQHLPLHTGAEDIDQLLSALQIATTLA